jgi:hypothetical protein
MRRFRLPAMVCGALLACIFGMCFSLKVSAQDVPSAPAANKNFKVAVYIPINIVERMRDLQYLNSTWKQISAGVKVDKVYIETYRSREMADGALIESVKKFFEGHGVEVAGGIAYSDRDAGQFRSFVYTNDVDRAYVQQVAEFTAKHFNEIILDDFFFDNTKDASDIAAKGNESWSQFRLKLMDEVSRNLIVGAARKVNPEVRIIIKFPNSYPSFQGNGDDLAVEPAIFSGIYTGTETRDPVITDQQFQQYESYEIVRYFDNVAPGRNGGGWVDTFSIRYTDRYTEQLWDMMLAKAPQIMLFEYSNLLLPARPEDRGAWADLHTSFDYQAWWPHSTPDFAAVAGKALNEIDPVIGKLGNPVGVSVYRPLNSTGEDFLANYLGENLPGTMDAPSQISLMEYDNKTFVVQSFRNQPVTVTVSVKGSANELRNLATGEMVEAAKSSTNANREIPGAEQQASFQIRVQPHTFDVFAITGTN